MADVADSKSVGSDTVRVQVPPSARIGNPLERVGFEGIFAAGKQAWRIRNGMAP